jgi:NitT/TauT family transport system ATP-binding protein
MADGRVTRTQTVPAVGATASGGAAAAGRGSTAISVRELSKVYRTRNSDVHAVHGASFEVKEGEFVALVGPSGCGKSTILHICAGLVPLTSGSAEVGGAAATSGRREVGLMFQAPVLLPWRTVTENILLPTEIFGLDRKSCRAKAQELIELVGLDGFEDKYPWELSGGMQQRCSLARVLVFEPDILLMDEPFAAVDEFTRERLNLELARIQESLGRTVLYVTHNIEEAVFLADRVVVMKPHPGEILDIVERKLPRPRTAEILSEPRTLELVIEIRQKLNANRGKEGTVNGG